MLLIFGANGGVGSAILRHAAGCNKWGGVSGVYRDVCDVSEDNSVGSYFDNLHNLDSSPDEPLYAVNATGKCLNGLCRKYSEADLMSMIASNITGCYLIAKHFHRVCRQRPGSALLLLSSVVSVTGVVGASAYGMCKAAVSGLVRSASKEYARDDLRLNCLRLGYYNTGMISQVDTKVTDRLMEDTPQRRFGSEGELYGAVDFCLTNEFLTGATVDVNGGLT